MLALGAGDARAQTEPVIVPEDWSPIPFGLGKGDTFRLLFLSSTKRNANPSGIGSYNTFVQNRAAAGHSAIQAYSSGFRVVGCTATFSNTRPMYGLSAVFQVHAPLSIDENSPLVPSGLGPGDSFRLLFLSSTTRDSSSSSIADYNAFVQNLATAGHSASRPYRSQFKAVGSTDDTDARDNTDTTFPASDKGVPIYWLGGSKLADNYQDGQAGGGNGAAGFLPFSLLKSPSRRGVLGQC